ncbi:hypothetical protein [Pseudomonas phage Njord]|uniref:Uncharacterized protein n=1 Tax=Pseudomonas phage Njord TaxID=2163985 RepID=A0A2S1GMI4_9CAUD|nr:hypothetical protein HOT08_gp02 [Pseudomonas phage Njord]AWD90590.1 hypothetical protein [Pseudomonas phage Njord]
MTTQTQNIANAAEFIEAGQPVTRMEELVVEISQALDNIQTESVRVGKLLTEASCEFKEQGKKATDFLAWAFAHFSIRKAQAYKLMTVAEHFGTDDRFAGVSMRVLYALATEANEDELNKAAELAANGSLTTTTLNLLLNPEPAKPAVKPIDATKEAGQASLGNVQAAEESAPNGVVQEPSAPVSNVAPGADSGSPWEGEAPAAGDEVVQLRNQVAELLAQIKTLTDAQVQHNNGAKAPTLPQFKSKVPYAVLGLSAEEALSDAKVKAAFRGLVKAGYGSGHSDFDALVAAKDALLSKPE